MEFTFDPKRFLKVFRNEYFIKSPQLLVSGAVLLGVTCLFFGFTYMVGSDIDFRSSTVLFFALALIGQLFIIHIHFSEFTSREKTQFLLMTPASQNEKFIAKCIATFVLYPLVMILYYYLFIRLIDFYNQCFYRNEMLKSSYTLEDATDFLRQALVIPTLLAVWIFFSSTTLLGVTTFRKYVHLKIIISWFAFFCGLTFLAFIVNGVVFGKFPNVCVPFAAITFENSSHNRDYVVLFEYYPYIVHYITFFTSVMCLIIAKLKFNERSV